MKAKKKKTVQLLAQHTSSYLVQITNYKNAGRKNMT